MGSCFDNVANLDIHSLSSNAIVSFLDSNEVTFETDPLSHEDAIVSFLSGTTQSAPIIINWEVKEIVGVLAFGISIGDNQSLLGSNITNFYYVSNGQIVLNGVVVATVPSIVINDVVSLWMNFAEGTGVFYLNNIRVY